MSLKLIPSGQENESKATLPPRQMADVSDVLKDLKDVRSRSPSYFCLVHQSGSCRAQMNPGGGLQTTASSTLTAIAITGCDTFASGMC